jgi:hypothetical protein
MATFPVEDSAGILEGVNYLLSGPAGLGQNFQGFSDYQSVIVRPTVRQPFVLPIDTTLDASWYFAIPISNMVPVNVVGGETNTVEITFTAQATAPFQFGDRIEVRGVDPDFYDDANYIVVSCTTSSLVFRTGSGRSFAWPTYVSGGTVGRDFKNFNISTDCNARVTIFGPTDQAFITCQFYGEFDYTCDSACDFDMEVKIDRYRGIPNVGSTDFTFFFDETVSTQSFNYTPSANGSDQFQAIFTTVLDSPGFGYYWYICQLRFNINGELEEDEFATQGTKPNLGTTTTFSGLTPINVDSNGTGAVLDIELNDAVDEAYDIESNITIYIDTPGTGYQVDDVLKILGTDLGGISPGNDLTLTVASVTNTGNAQPGIVTANLRSLTAQVIKE